MNTLAADMMRVVPPVDGVSLWTLGQAGFLIRTSRVTIGIDLYLSGWLERRSEDNPHPVERARPSPMSPDELPDIDVLLATHGHPDHLDPGTVLALAKREVVPQVVVPEPLRDLVVERGIPDDRVVGALRDRRYELPHLDVVAVAAAHAIHPEAFGGYTFWLDDRGRDCALGYLLELDGVRIYHSGDTVYWPGMAEHLRGLDIDVALLPINGRDWARERRGIVGNLTAGEAAELAWHADIDLVVPCHYDGIVGNTVDPGDFASYVMQHRPTQAFKLLQQGEELRYRP